MMITFCLVRSNHFTFQLMNSSGANTFSFLIFSKCEPGRSVSTYANRWPLFSKHCSVCVCCGRLGGEKLVVYEESQLSDTTLIFSLPAFSLFLLSLPLCLSLHQSLYLCSMSYHNSYYLHTPLLKNKNSL